MKPNSDFKLPPLPKKPHFADQREKTAKIASKSKQIANEMIRRMSLSEINKIKDSVSEALTFIFNDDDERPFEAKKSNLLLVSKTS